MHQRQAAMAPAMAAVMAGAKAGVTSASTFLTVLLWYQAVSHPSREIVMDGVLIFF